MVSSQFAETRQVVLVTQQVVAPPEYVRVHTETQANLEVYCDLLECHAMDAPFKIFDSELLDPSVHLSASNSLAILALAFCMSSLVSILRRIRFTGLLVRRGYASKYVLDG